MNEPPLTRRERLRRTAILCIHAARNLAYYRTGWDGSTPLFDRRQRIVGTINANFLDIMVMEWCKLFVASESHAWQRIVTDKDEFYSGLLAHLNCDAAAFDAFIDAMRAYRDKFVAHLDSRRTMEPPKLDMAKESAFYYHRYLLKNEHDGPTYSPDLDFDIEAFFEDCFAEGLEFNARPVSGGA